MRSPFTPPLDADLLLRKKRAIRRELLAPDTALEERRIAILGGSTTAEVKDQLELFLLNAGIKAQFYESDYGRYFEDLGFPNPDLSAFRPDFIYLHTTNHNITSYPSFTDDEAEVERLLDVQTAKFARLWDNVERWYGCPVIQNNFEPPFARLIGNLDFSLIQGRTRFIGELNRRFGEAARTRAQLYINDINYLSAWIGLERWYDLPARYAYKYAMSLEAIPHLAQSIGAIISAILGKSKKCLVLDLDNTLWGGVIGDDGLGGIELGQETATAEGHTEFQRYVGAMKDRGVILAVCSKNDHGTALEGFTHVDSILTAEDFSDFQANWNPKHINVRRIAENLNIGIDSLVFVDDNPVEREIVSAQEPLVAVPEVGDDITRFITVLDKSGLFETVSLSEEDLRRASLYSEETKRAGAEAQFANYDEFLRSLDMSADIRPVDGLVLERAVQLCNKTNQFNVTTRRTTTPEMTTMIADTAWIVLYGRLKDKFGDSGLISLMAGEIKGNALDISIWLMSCRVLKRGMEGAMLDRMVALAAERGLTSMVGYYLPTAKNKMVSGLFADMGFERCADGPGRENRWELDLTKPYQNRDSIIRVNDGN